MMARHLAWSFILVAILVGLSARAAAVPPAPEGTPEDVRLAEEDHAESLREVLHPGNHEFWGAVFNVLVLILLLTWFGQRPLRKYLRERRLSIADGLTDAQRMKAEAQAKYEEYSSRLANLDQELEQIRTDMVRAGEAERDRIVAEAEAKATRMRRDAEFRIDQEMKQLREDLIRETVEAAIAAAGDVLRSQTGAEDQQRLARSYLQTLEQIGREGAAGNGTATSPTQPREERV